MAGDTQICGIRSRTGFEPGEVGTKTAIRIPSFEFVQVQAPEGKQAQVQPVRRWRLAAEPGEWRCDSHSAGRRKANPALLSAEPALPAPVSLFCQYH
jgi:hypothetical protein